MTRIDTVISDVRSYMMESAQEPAEFAIQAGIHPNTLKDYETPEWAPTSTTLRKLEQAIEKHARTQEALKIGLEILELREAAR